MTTNLLSETGRLKLQLERLHADARRLAAEPGGTPSWPVEAVAEADELVEALDEARRRAEKLYRVTPPPWRIRELEEADR